MAVSCIYFTFYIYCGFAILKKNLAKGFCKMCVNNSKVK